MGNFPNTDAGKIDAALFAAENTDSVQQVDVPNGQVVVGNSNAPEVSEQTGVTDGTNTLFVIRRARLGDPLLGESAASITLLDDRNDSVPSSEIAAQEFDCIKLGSSGPVALFGISGFVWNQGTGEVPSIVGIGIGVENDAGCHVTGDMICIDVQPPFNSGTVDGATIALKIRDCGADHAIKVEGGKSEFAGPIILSNLPTSDPNVAGQLWNSSGTLKVSAG